MTPKLIKVLLVEDDPGDAFWIKELLQEAGRSLYRFELRHFSRLFEARAYLAREKPDAVLLDLGLPDSQGMETLRSILEAGANLPVVVLTGFADEEFEADAIQQGAQDYLIKGQYNQDQLVRSLRYALERGQAEEALRQSEERYRRLVEMSPETVAVHQDGKYVFINQAGARVFGASSPEEICGRSVLDLVHPDYRDLVRDRMQKAQEGGRTELRETKILRLDGSVADVEATGLGIDYLGKPAVLALIRDITARKEAERALRRSEEIQRAKAAELQAVLDATPAIIWMAEDLECRRISGNPTAYEILRLPAGSNLSKSAPEEGERPTNYEVMRNGKALAPQEMPVQRAAAGETICNYEFDVVFKDGDIRHLLGNAVPLLDELGRPRGSVAAFVDVTERQQAEEALNRSVQRLDLLAETARLLLESVAPQRVVDVICQKVMEFLDCQAFFNFLVDEQEGRLHLNACAGIPEEEARRIEWLDYGVAVCGCAARDGCRIIAENISETPDPRTDLVKSYGIQAYACHPLMVEGRVIGTLSFGTSTRATFTADELALMKAVADQVAIAMDRKQAEEALRQAHDELEGRVQERTAVLQGTIHALEREAAERQEAEETVARHAAQVQDLYNNAPCGYHSLDPEGTFVQINDTELSWLGYTREEVLGRLKFSDLLTTDSRKTFKKNFPGFIGRGWVSDLEFELVRKDGTILPVLLSATAVKDEAGHFLMSRSTVYDITARRQAAEALEAERQRLLAVLERVPAYVALISPNHTIPYANREFIKRFGDPEGRLCYEFLFGLDAPCEGCNALKVFKTNKPEIWEWTGPAGNIYQIYDYPFTDVDGSPLVLEMGLDISARKHSEEAVKRSEALLRTILETLPVGVGVCDQDGRIAMENPAIKEIWGGARYVGIGQYGQYKGWWPDTGKRIKSEEWGLARAIRKGETSLNEVVEIESFDGVRKFILVSAVPIRGPNQEITAAIVVNQDITELKAAEAKINRINRLYSVLSKVNEAIVRIRDPLHLYQEACRILVNEGGFRMAWVGLRDPASLQVKPVAYEGIERGYLERIAITYLDTPEGAGPTGVAIREGRHDICADFAQDPRMAPWREGALKRGYRSSMALPLRQDANVMGAIAIYADQPEFFKDEEIHLLEFMAADLSFALESMDLEKKRRQAAASLARSEQKLRRLTSQLMSAQEQERSRVSRELHDELGQSLLVLKMQMRAIQRQMGEGEQGYKEEIGASLNFLDEVIENVRRLSRNLSPLILEGLGLNEALKNLFDEFAKHYAINHVQVNLDVVEGLIPQESQINIYRIFQEALTNIAKYAHPTKVTVEMQKMAKAVSFRIEDDGAGFDLEEIMSRQGKGMGLATMSERVKIMGGTFHIKTKQGQGTRITFSLPVD